MTIIHTISIIFLLVATTAEADTSSSSSRSRGPPPPGWEWHSSSSSKDHSKHPSKGPANHPISGPTWDGDGHNKGGCKCDAGDIEFIFNSEAMTWISHYKIAKSQGCELASIANSDEQFQALSSAVLAWELQPPIATGFNLNATWIGGKRIKAEGGGRMTNGFVDQSPWRWSDGTPWKYTNWNYNEPSDGRYCDPEDQFCYENRVILQVIDQVFDLPAGKSDIEGNNNITLDAGDWHDIQGNLMFPGLYKCCYEYQCSADIDDETETMMEE